VPTLTISLDRPHAGQQRVIAEAKRFNVLQCGRRWGKTSLGINRLIDTGLRGGRAAWFAPTYKFLADVWRELLSVVAPLGPDVSVQEKRVRLPTGGVIEFWSLDQPDAGRGRKYHRVGIDEASIVRNLEQAWSDAIRPTLTDFKGDAWLFGTPKGMDYFHRLYARGQDPGNANWASWRMPTVSNPFIDPAEVEAARLEMPASAFNQEYLGIPADDGGNPFGIDAIAACVAPLSTRPAAAAGIDLAKSEDWTVVTQLDRDGAVCGLDRWQSDWGQTRRRVVQLIGSTPGVADSTGVGDPVLEEIQRDGAKVDGFKFSAQSKQMLMEGLAASIQQKQVRFPDGWLRSELELFEYQYRPGGVRYSAPNGVHDDGVCSLALAVHCLKGLASRPRITPVSSSAFAISQ
jgi:hypothetical protein